MKKQVTLIQCYSDHNYGDLGIILSTADLFYDADIDVQINSISTYNYDDKRFNTEHEDLKDYLLKHDGKMFPGIFGIVDRDKKFIYIRSFLSLLRFLLFVPLIKQSWAAKILLNKSEIESYNLLKNSDLVVSKGGSYFCDDNGKLGFLSFFRLWYIGLMAIKLGKKVVILGQSIGPLNTSLGKSFGNYLLKRFNKVILRESVCLKEYDYFIKRDYVINNDMVFFQKLVKPSINENINKTVGVTVKYVDKDQDKYFVFMKEAITLLVNKYNFDVVMLPQVPLDNDIKASKEIWETLGAEIKNRVRILDDLNGINNLLNEYAKLYFVLGTRLHSCIFSWSVGVPAINISYHGTKSQGIYDNLGLRNWVLNYSSDESISLFEKNVNSILESRSSIIEKVTERISKDKEQVGELIKNLLVS
ncbi:polysaccharide pyruvyl transferase family protein [Pedobacter panaciterrae]